MLEKIGKAIDLLGHPRLAAEKVRTALSRRRFPVVQGLATLPETEEVYERSFREAFLLNAFTALGFNGISGAYAEFGCHAAMSFSIAYHASQRCGVERHQWAFDSFAGLPAHVDATDAHPSWVAGRWAMSLEEFRAVCALNQVPETAYTAVQGFYEQSLPALGDSEPRDIALAYVDCDLYSSTLTVLEFLKPRLKHGMILAFDDYHCWSSEQLAGERRAMLEVLEPCEEWVFAPYLSFGWAGQSFVVERRALHEGLG